MLILEDLCWGLGVVEQLVDLLHLLPLHRLLPLNSAQHAGWSQQLDGVPARSSTDNVWDIVLHQSLLRCFPVGIKPSDWTVNRRLSPASSVPEGGFSSDLRQVWERLLADVDAFSLSPNLYDLKKKKGNTKSISFLTNGKVWHCWLLLMLVLIYIGEHCCHDIGKGVDIRHPADLQVFWTWSYLLHLLRRVQHGADDHHSIQQVSWNPVWGADVLGAPGGQSAAVSAAVVLAEEQVQVVTVKQLTWSNSFLCWMRRPRWERWCSPALCGGTWSTRCPACAPRPQRARRAPARPRPGRCSGSPPCWSRPAACLQRETWCHHACVERVMSGACRFFSSTCDLSLLGLHQLPHHGQDVLASLESNRQSLKEQLGERRAHGNHGYAPAVWRWRRPGRAASRPGRSPSSCGRRLWAAARTPPPPGRTLSQKCRSGLVSVHNTVTTFFTPLQVVFSQLVAIVFYIFTT